MESERFWRKLQAGVCPISNQPVQQCSRCVEGDPNHSPQGFHARLFSLLRESPYAKRFILDICDDLE